MVHVADHRVMPGKKLWTWGSGPSGRIWEDILSEGGGAYYEPQAGAFSDNQPDYHWLAPHEVRRAHDYWYPVRDIRGFQKANADFAVQTDLRDGKAFAGVHATSVFEGLKLVLRDARDGHVLRETTARVAPDRPLLVEVSAPAGATVYDLQLAVSDAAGRPQIELQRRAPREVALPEPQKEWGEPSAMTPDELFHCGEWLDRFRRTPEAMRCYQEALRRDPADSRVNVEMGFLARSRPASRTPRASSTWPRSATPTTPGSTSVARSWPSGSGAPTTRTSASAARPSRGTRPARRAWGSPGWSCAAGETRRPSTGCARPRR